MATIGRVNGASFNNTPRLLYIATAAFDTYFYSYSTSINAALVTIGTLGPVTGATPSNCPRGRVLRENGRKLYPEANPGITTYMVGVYDAQTLLSGFIDPNAKVFQIYNTDKPTYLADGVDPTTDTTDRGPSIFTLGDVLGFGNLDISGNGVIYGDLRVDGDGLIERDLGVVDNVDISGNMVIYGTTTLKTDVNVSSGNLAISNGYLKLNESNGPAPGSYNAENAIVGTAGFNNNSSITITTTSCFTTSYVLVTLKAGGSAVLSISATNNGSFTVSSNAGNTNDTFNWLIINPT